jgi:antitoxin component of RelBE/YafQ-DinJ toxin-antitoxin module
MSTNTAFNIYVRQVVRSRRIPFAIEVPAKDDIMKFRLDFFEKKSYLAESACKMRTN